MPTLTVPCPACGAPDHVPLHAARDRWLGVPGTFRWARCAACDQAYLRERPDDAELARFYPPAYVRPGRAPAWLKRALDRLDLGARVRLVRSLAGPSGRVLDVGCARGDFLAAVRDGGGVAALGVEPSAWLADAAEARGLSVRRGTLSDVDLPPAGVDVATLWDVVEHLPAPAADLARLAAAVRPGGHLVVATPLLDGWEARAWGQRWPGWDTPRHLAVYTHETLERLLSTAGFQAVAWRYTSESYLITAMAVSQAARELLPRPAAALVHAALHARPVRLLMRPVFAALDRLLGGCWATVVAVRTAGPPAAATALASAARTTVQSARGSAASGHLPAPAAVNGDGATPCA